MTERSDSERQDGPGRERAARASLGRGGGSFGWSGVVLAAVAGLLAVAAGLSAVGADAPARSVSVADGDAPPSRTTGSDTTPSDSLPELGDVIRYELAVRSDTASPERTWRVIQGPDVASLFSPSSLSGDGGDLEAAWGVVGPAVGGRLWLVKADRKELVALWEDAPLYRPGLAATRGQSRVVLRGLDYRFFRGPSDGEMAGRRAQHWVLEADVRLIFEPRGLGRGLGSDSADVHLRTDFWFLRDVPFSWAPLAASGVNALSIGMDPIARTLREDLEPYFRLLGLPVRTETVERWSPYGTPDVAMPSGERRSSRVEGLEAAAPPAADPGVLEYGRVLPGEGPPAPRNAGRRGRRGPPAADRDPGADARR